jgi:hypothetical protein
MCNMREAREREVSENLLSGPWVGLAGQTQGPCFLKLFEITLTDNLKK